MLLFVKIELFFVLKNIVRDKFLSAKMYNLTVKEENAKIGLHYRCAVSFPLFTVNLVEF